MSLPVKAEAGVAEKQNKIAAAHSNRLSIERSFRKAYLGAGLGLVLRLLNVFF